MHTSLQRCRGRITVLVVAIGVLAWGFWPLHRDAPRRKSGEESPATLKAGNPNRSLRQTEDVSELFISASDSLKLNPGPAQSRKIFAELHGILSGMSREVASSIIRRLLDSNLDAPSQLDFKVRPDGFLNQPSSLRVFLLDELGQVDRAAAAGYAEKSLGSLSSPDEWALSLRNYALGVTNAEARAFLQQKLREMLRHESWQIDPSAGFLEAFDMAVHAGGKELLPDLAELVRQRGNKAVAHAAYLALDRLAVQDPTVVLSELASKPDLMEGREETRANYFARANMENPQQKAILESYLLDPRRSETELRTFTGLFPNANFSVSYNLLTRTVTPTGKMIARQDRAALQALEGWMNDPRFEKLRPNLQEIANRLEAFVGNPKAKH